MRIFPLGDNAITIEFGNEVSLEVNEKALALAEYFDAIGIVPWWLKYCLFKSDHMEPKAVELYDRLIVPISRALERLVTPPIGKSVILVAENGQSQL